MNRPRVIPTLLIQDCSLVKTKRFKEPRYLGDPVNAIRIFNEKCVDELCVLDINASRKGNSPDYELLNKMASEAFMPLSYGGGIKDLDQIKKLFRIGYEKVIINTSAVRNPKLISEASDYFGSQSIVCAIDYKNGLFRNHCYINDGNQKVDFDPVEIGKKMVAAGAGEILLYSMDRDGMRIGYELKMIKELSDRVTAPVIACGGARDIKDFRLALDAGADAVAAGSMFVYFGNRQAVLINYPEEKEFYENGIYSK